MGYRHSPTTQSIIPDRPIPDTQAHTSEIQDVTWTERPRVFIGIAKAIGVFWAVSDFHVGTEVKTRYGSLAKCDLIAGASILE